MSIRSRLAILISAAMLAAGAAVLAQQPMADAAVKLTHPTIKVVPGDRTLSVRWSLVPGAKSYRVQYSTTKNFKKKVGSGKLGAKRTTFIAHKKVVNGKALFVRVLAQAGKVKKFSKVIKAKPTAGYPRAMTVNASPGPKPNTIKVTWAWDPHTKGPMNLRATSLVVFAGSQKSITGTKINGVPTMSTTDTFHSVRIKATASSKVVKIPQGMQAKFGTGSGNPIFVRVGAWNHKATVKKIPLKSSNTFRWSTMDDVQPQTGKKQAIYTYAPAQAPAVGSTQIRVAEWNVNSVSDSDGVDGPGLRNFYWHKRVDAVVNSVKQQHPDVFVTAELSSVLNMDASLNYLGSKVRGSTSQLDSLKTAMRIAQMGYTDVPVTSVGGVDEASHIFYNTATTELVANRYGTIDPNASTSATSPADGLGITWPVRTRKIWSWAQLRDRSTGKIFTVVAIHLPVTNKKVPATSNALRNSLVEALNQMLIRKGLHTRPVIIAGDFNSSFNAFPDGPDQTLRNLGYYDTSSSVTPNPNTRYATANLSVYGQSQQTNGYPDAPSLYPYPAPRIDFIFTLNAPGAKSYENVIPLLNGKFDDNYRGSDHNMQVADIGIP